MMKRFMPVRVAALGLLFILSFVIVFHLLVIAQIIPFAIVWGGNIADKNQLWLMESVSIAINMAMVLFVAIYVGLIKIRVNQITVRIVFGIMFVIFMANTFGNLLAKHNLETYIFTPLTLLLALFCLRIATAGREESIAVKR